MQLMHKTTRYDTAPPREEEANTITLCIKFNKLLQVNKNNAAQRSLT